MTLEKAILYVIEKEGIGIIGETRFVNYLNDLQAFDMPAVKRIVVTMVSGGYAEKLKHSLTTDHYQPDVNDAKSRLVNNEGFQANLVEYVLNCLLFATKKTTLAPVMPSAAASLATSTTTTSTSISKAASTTAPAASSPARIKRKSISSAHQLKPIIPAGSLHDPTGEYRNYHFPTLDLLTPLDNSLQEKYFLFLPLRAAFSSKVFQESRAQLPICLGVTENEEGFVVDLAKLPHLLVAGSTGTGKSLLMHTIILSMLYKLGPSEVKFVLIDPQRVELSPYADIERFYLAKSESYSSAILSEPNEVGPTLVSITQEIDLRFKILNKVSVRDVYDYNQKWRTELRMETDVNGNCRYEYLPRIVIIIDEFSSYVQNVSNFQNLISQIASKGRAVGVHLVLSTNAIGARILTPSLKSQFPARIAFDVPQAQESIRILDYLGAEKLNLKGRLIFKTGDTRFLLQSPYMHGTEISRICDHIKSQERTDANSSRKCYLLNHAIGELLIDRDPLFEEAVRFVVMARTASTSSLQRRFEIGYNRAGRLMDQMERAGVVGPAVGSKPRQVLVSPMDIDQLFDAGMPFITNHTRTALLSNSGETPNSDSLPKQNQPKKEKHKYFEVDWFAIIVFAIIILIALAIVYNE